MERVSSRLTMAFITFIWIVFLLGIILYEPYTKKHAPKIEEAPIEKIINEIEGETVE